MKTTELQGVTLTTEAAQRELRAAAAEARSKPVETRKEEAAETLKEEAVETRKEEAAAPLKVEAAAPLKEATHYNMLGFAAGIIGVILIALGIYYASKNDWFKISDTKKLGSAIARPLTYAYGLLPKLNSYQR